MRAFSAQGRTWSELKWAEVSLWTFVTGCGTSTNTMALSAQYFMNFALRPTFYSICIYFIFNYRPFSLRKHLSLLLGMSYLHVLFPSNQFLLGLLGNWNSLAPVTVTNWFVPVFENWNIGCYTAGQLELTTTFKSQRLWARSGISPWRVAQIPRLLYFPRWWFGISNSWGRALRGATLGLKRPKMLSDSIHGWSRNCEYFLFSMTRC